MKETGRKKYEQETTITFNEAEPHAIVWSCSQEFEKKMEKLGIKAWNNCGGLSWHIPKSWIKVGKKDLRDV